MIRKLSNKGINSNRRSSGIGYIVIPKGIDRETYIKTCFRTGTVTLYIEDGFDINNRVKIGKFAIQLIKFPKKVGELGSPVLWVNYPGQEEPVITEVLFNQEEGIDIQENSFLLKKESGKAGSQIFLTDDGKIVISVSSQREDEVEIDIRSIGESNTGKVNITSNGEINVISDKVVNIKSELINHNKGGQPMVLGNTLFEKLDSLLGIMLNTKTTTSIGLQPFDPATLIDLQELKTNLEEIKSKISNLD